MFYNRVRDPNEGKHSPRNTDQTNNNVNVVSVTGESPLLAAVLAQQQQQQQFVPTTSASAQQNPIEGVPCLAVTTDKIKSEQLPSSMLLLQPQVCDIKWQM